MSETPRAQRAPGASNGGANLGFEQKMWLAADEIRGHPGICDSDSRRCWGVSLPRGAGTVGRAIRASDGVGGLLGRR